ncbi:MAG: class I SAM-dependent methyltransferase [Pseudohongiellaceae bacterium]
MNKAEFKTMWENMQTNGYFSNHPHYEDYFGKAPTEQDKKLDEIILSLDFSQPDIYIPIPYSEALERSAKRTEPIWLPKTFDLPQSGVALDLGCGFGRSVRWLSQQYQRVIGTDISAQVIGTAKELCKDISNVDFYVNEADSLPPEVTPNSINMAYIFTVFQHIPRQYTLELLKKIQLALSPEGVVVFNLVSMINESINDGAVETEWAIGYSKEQAEDLVKQAGLNLQKIVSWSGPESAASWLWVAASKTPNSTN